jgi:hypothetical protein
MQDADSWWFQKRWSSFRSGSTSISITWADGGQATVKLFDEGAPKTVRGFEGILPVDVDVVHVAWSGEMVMSCETLSFGPSEAENEVRLVRPGDLTWDPRFGELGLVYGDAECRLPSGPHTVVVFGQVVAGIEDLASFCRQRRFAGVGTIRFEKARLWAENEKATP